MSFFRFLLSFFFFLVVFSQSADAYIDPGAGSYFLQLAAAGIFAALFFVTSSWRWLKERIRRVFRKKKEINGDTT